MTLQVYDDDVEDTLAHYRRTGEVANDAEAARLRRSPAAQGVPRAAKDSRQALEPAPRGVASSSLYSIGIP